MQYINKQPNPSGGTEIIDDFLSDCWTGDNYLTAEYHRLPKPPIRQYLLDEQGHLCCYCMKSLVNDHTTTLEHIAPHQCDVMEFNKYNFPAIVQNVTHSSLFDRAMPLVIPGLYPHDIAYHNLLASCDSKSHCNNYRGERFINCPFYDNVISQKVEYDEEGNAFSAEYLDDLEIVGISVNPSLIVTRKIWFELARLKNTLDDVTNDDILEVIAEITVTDKFQTVLNDFWVLPPEKASLVKYKWFFDYYKQQQNNN